MRACRSAIKFHSLVFSTHKQSKSNLIPTSKTKLKFFCYPSLFLKISSGRTPPLVRAYANYSDAVENGAYDRTVSVMLILHKECQFGEEFYAVGAVESLGSWDPQKAVPMEWNPGHIWTTPPMDLPVGKEICFKFILRDQEGEIQWQPGSDRVFHSCETRGTLLVSLGWDDVDVQTYTEEEEGEEYEEGIAKSRVGRVEGEGIDGWVPVLVPGLKGEADSVGAECSSIGNDPVLVRGLTAADSGGASEFSSIGNDPVLVPGLITMMDYGRDKRTEDLENGAYKEKEEEKVTGDEKRTEDSENGAYKEKEEEKVTGGENSYVLSDDHSSVSDAEEALTISNVAQTSVVDGEEASTSTAIETSVVDGEEASTSTVMEGVENQDTADSSESSCNEGEHSDSVKYPVGTPVLQKDFDWGRNALSKLIWSLGLKDE